MGWLTAHERGAEASLLPASGPSAGHRGVGEKNGYRELDGTQLSGTLTRRTTSSTIVNPRFR